MSWRSLAFVVVAAAALAAPAGAADPLVRQAAGGDVAAITPARDQFRADLGGGTTPGTDGSFGGVRREINWDGAPDSVADPEAFPGGFFNSNSPRGAQFATPGLGFALSSDDDNPADPEPDDVRFSSLEKTYATAFASFSPQRLFTPFASPTTDTLFFVPGAGAQATTNGFGVVFTDVDRAGSATLELIGPDGGDLGEFRAPPAGGDGGLSFVGARSPTRSPSSPRSSLNPRPRRLGSTTRRSNRTSTSGVGMSVRIPSGHSSSSSSARSDPEA